METNQYHATTPGSSPNDHRPAFVPATKNRLTLRHLLLWIAASAAFISIYQLLKPNLGSEHLEHFAAVLAAFQSLGTGAALACGIVGICRFIQGRLFPLQPGQILLFIHGGMLVLGTLYAVTAGREWLVAAEGVFWAMAAATYIATARLLREARWKLAFSIIAIWTALRAVILLFQTPPGYIGIVPVFSMDDVLAVTAPFVIVPVLIFATSRDARGGISRDWMHWVGVVVECWHRILVAIAHVGLALIQSGYFGG